VRAVDWVDDPEPATLPVRVLAAGRLLGEHAVVWVLAAEDIEDGIMDDEISLGHEVAAALGERVLAMAVAGRNDARCLLGACAGHLFSGLTAGRLREFGHAAYMRSGALIPISERARASTILAAETSFRRAIESASSSESTRHFS
jgi:hypothetical protein